MKLKLSILALISLLFFPVSSWSQYPVFDWGANFGPPSGVQGSAQGKFVGYDSLGNVYVTGQFERNIDADPDTSTYLMSTPPLLGNTQVFVAKLSPTGALLWAGQIGSDYHDYVNSMVVDPAGNLYISGRFDVATDVDPGPGTYFLYAKGAYDSYLLKINTSGNLVWARQLESLLNSDLRSLALDNSENILGFASFRDSIDIATGPPVNMIYASGTGADYLLLRYTPSGNVSLMAHYETDGNATLGGINVDGNDDIVFMGSFYDSLDVDPGPGVYNLYSGGNQDVFIVKLDASANLVWGKNIMGPAADRAGGINVDSNNDIVFTGDFEAGADLDPGIGSFVISSLRPCLVKWDANGNFIWGNYYMGGWDVRSGGVMLGPSGQIYVVGLYEQTVDFNPLGGGYVMSSTSGTDDIYFTMHHPNGTFLWAGTFNGLDVEYVRSAVCDQANRIYVCGEYKNICDLDPGLGQFNIMTVNSGYGGFVSKLNIGSCTPTSGTTSISACGSYTSPSGNQTWTSSGTYSDVLVNSVGCDSNLTINLTITQAYSSSTSAGICNGDSLVFGTQTLYNSGTYTEVYTAVNGCDSTVTLTLNVEPTYTLTDAAAICSGHSYFFGTQTLTSAGTFTEVFTSSGGCDSTVTLTLSVNPTFSSNDAATICSGDNYTFGAQILTSAGTYTEVFTAQNGCDSTVTLNLSVNPSYSGTDAAAICSGDSYVFGSQTLTTAGTFTEVFSTANGCDSTVTLTLTVNTPYTTSDATAICPGDSYSFGTQTLTTAGTYTEVFSAANGCDSTVTLNLSISPIFNTADAAAICNGDNYSFGTQTLTGAGTYTEVFTSSYGCDSTVTLTLSVNPVYSTTDAATICNGDSYSFGTQTLTAAGSYSEVFMAQNGCDSTVNLTLSVNPVYSTTDAASICTGDTYQFGSQTLSSAGTYTEVFTAQNGCDSTVTLTLSVSSMVTQTASASICDGDTYTFGTQNLTSAGTYTEIFPGAMGCDTSVTLNLTVNPAFTLNDTAHICDGDVYTLGSQNLTTAGNYQEVFTALNGCDSTVMLTLFVDPVYSSTQTVDLCEHETYPFGSQVISQSGTYTETFIAQNGCDSTVTLTAIVTDVDSTIIQSGNSLVANQVGASYQWFICGNPIILIANETAQDFGPNTNGLYGVIVTLNGCRDTSACYLFNLNGLNQEPANGISLYPNPGRDYFKVVLGHDAVELRLEVIDLYGRVLLSETRFNGSEVELQPHVASGIYWIRVIADGREEYLKWVRE